MEKKKKKKRRLGAGDMIDRKKNIYISLESGVQM